MSAAEQLDLPPMTFDDFVEHERNSPVRHEIWDGTLVAMAGGTEEHTDVARNVLSDLDQAYQSGGCKPFGSDIMVFCPDQKKGAYPDVSAVCGPREFRPEKDPEARRVLLNPTLVVEVLSPSTYDRDLGAKFERYQSIPSLAEYVLIDPTTPWVRQFTRNASGWQITTQTDPEALVRLSSVGVELAMSRVYFGVPTGPRSRVASFLRDEEPDEG